MRQTILLDDDPTGTQTVSGVAVLTEWSVETLASELERGNAGFFVLTNSRALNTEAAHALYQEIGRNLKVASAQTQIPVRVLARGDSTLRGHFPAETDALDQELGPHYLTLIVPYFEEGERRTRGDIHYVGETPAAQTPFAQDAVFGFRSSNLREWVEEKTAGRVKASEVASLSQATLEEGVTATTAFLSTLLPNTYCIVNANLPQHTQTLAQAVFALEASGKRILARTAASFGAACLGQESAPLAILSEHDTGPGGLIIVGSHVPKTTEQLAYLQEQVVLDAYELGTEDSTGLDAALAAGHDVLIYTPRAVVSGDLATSAEFSSRLVNLVKKITVRPRWILAKGGITSSDIATQALNVKRAEVVGPILPGVPLWRTGDESRWPGLLYVVFPGNVGGPEALFAARERLHGEINTNMKTTLSIKGDAFFINGKPTYAGRTWKGHKIEGLLLNSRVVQATFDDLNPETRSRWASPDGMPYDAEKNTERFIAMLPEWRKAGLLSFTVNLQGGSPEGYSKSQPWHNSAINADGSLRPDYLKRLEKILNRADALGMAPILGIFYFGQDQRVKDEVAVIRAVDNTVEWLLQKGWRNLLLEINNECNVAAYDHQILKPARVHELILRAKAKTRSGQRLLVGTSYGGGFVPLENVVRASDFLLIHGNGVSDPKRIPQMVVETRAVPGYRPMPILFNEDDHFDFEKPNNNFVAALSQYASWGYFDYRMKDEKIEEGYQSMPCDWGSNSARKKGFFKLLKEVTGA
ncbi:four-carbon acid sugar kinase family protein [Armatimonas sp.]|uniref:four-carbon acid sugar kinase family protein n=1 Tax=Armatimonas sp. TaxID=1872638 RepID=UPI0037520BB6